MFSCTNALAQTIGALRKQDWHHPNTPDITQTIQALSKQSFPHIHSSFPRRRESIIMRHLATKMDPRLRGDDEHGDVLVHQRACSNNRGTTQTGLAPSKHSRHYPNDTGTEQTVVPASPPVIPAKAGIHSWVCYFLGNRPERLRLGEFLSSFFLTREKGFSLDLNSTRTGVPCRSKTRRKVFSR